MLEPLSENYYDRLNDLAATIQESPLLAQYLEEEDDELYNEFRGVFEPQMAALHNQVAAEAPLQLAALERYMLDPAFEGLYLPRILGFAVLRGEVNDQFRYLRPNDHFKEVLLAIANSVHFEQIKKRIGQTIQVGFALSSDIWITNLLAQVENKKVRNFFQQQKNDRFRDHREREQLYDRYARQFRNELYYSAEFPQTLGEMKANFSALRLFLLKRFAVGGENSSLKDKIVAFLDNPDFHGTPEYLEMLSIYGLFMERTADEQKAFSTHFERERRTYPGFDKQFLRFLAELQGSEVHIGSREDERMSRSIDKAYKDKLSEFYRIADKVHSLGYVHPDTIEAVQDFYNSHEGLSVESECLRHLILQYFDRLINGLSEEEYADYFELNKIFGLYMKIFNNQQFNQAVEKQSMNYVRKLLLKYTDKRGKDYQDIKRFVSTTFVDFGFLTDKEVVDIFKTRRKKRASDEA
ncbi:MAG: hypothetical protein SFV52_01710 [Saprospiraceae bacterium]|nr:hypothetical protein [Saprospiraceae bacterium]